MMITTQYAKSIKYNLTKLVVDADAAYRFTMSEILWEVILLVLYVGW